MPSLPYSTSLTCWGDARLKGVPAAAAASDSKVRMRVWKGVVMVVRIMQGANASLERVMVVVRIMRGEDASLEMVMVVVRKVY